MSASPIREHDEREFITTEIISSLQDLITNEDILEYPIYVASHNYPLQNFNQFFTPKTIPLSKFIKSNNYSFIFFDPDFFIKEKGVLIINSRIEHYMQFLGYIIVAFNYREGIRIIDSSDIFRGRFIKMEYYNKEQDIRLKYYIYPEYPSNDLEINELLISNTIFPTRYESEEYQLYFLKWNEATMKLYNNQNKSKITFHYIPNKIKQEEKILYYFGTNITFGEIVNDILKIIKVSKDLPKDVFLSIPKTTFNEAIRFKIDDINSKRRLSDYHTSRLLELVVWILI